jgi:hypothetical protein
MSGTGERKITETLKQKSTFTVTSDRDLTVEAGGSLKGFGCVAIYESPVHVEKISLNPEVDGIDRGAGFSYADVARINVNDKILWINNQLPEAPTGRQDVIGRGSVKIEFFDSDKLRKLFERNKEAFKKLGLCLPEWQVIQE